MTSTGKGIVFIAIAWALFSAAIPAAQSDPQYISSTLWSKAFDTVIDGHLAYCSFLNGLTVLDLADIRNPKPLSTLFLGGGGAIRKRDHFAWVAAGKEGVKIVDVADPARPRLAGTIPVKGEARNILLNDNLIYISTGSGGLVICDIRDPNHPKKRSELDLEGEIGDAARQGDYLYVAGGDKGIHVIDAADPAQPRIVATAATGGTAKEIALAGSSAFVANGAEGMAVLDLSTPQAPKVAARFPASSFTNSIALSGTVACLGTLYDGGFQLVDISIPTKPVSLSITKYTMYNEAWNVAISGNRAVVTDYFAGIYFLDVSDPKKPEVVGSHFTPSSIIAAQLQNDRLIAVGELSGLQVYSAKDPEHPLPVSASRIFRGVHNLTVAGATAYVTARAGLMMFDITTAPEVAILQTLRLPGVPRAVQVRDGYAYVTADLAGFHIVDIAKPKEAKLVSTFPMAGFAYGLDVVGDRAYICSSDTGFHILDISDRTAPKSIGQFRTAGEPYGVAVRDGFAYIADGPEGLQILDVTDPAAIAAVGQCSWEGFANSIAIHGDRVYISDETSGAKVFSIRNPKQPQLIGSFKTTGEPSRISVSGNLIIMADSFSVFLLRDGAD